MRTVNSFIGSPIERCEDLRFLRGRGQYVDDLVRPGLLHAAILRSSLAHGRIRSIDAARALAMPPKVTTDMAQGFTLYMLKAVLNGRVIDEATIAQAEAAASAAVDPQTDIHASADYRRALVGTMVERALRNAAAPRGKS